MKNRVPEIVFLYWIIKIASTTLGETGADMFSMTLHLGYGATIAIFISLFIVLLAAKLTLGRYEPITYWLTFTATAIAGTAISDFIDRTLGLGYAVGAAALVTLLLVVLKLWHQKERSISVENIRTPSAESFYWIAFLVANTLGTAAGDYLADDLGLGFMFSAGLISGLLLVTALCHYYTRTPGTLLFWIAFVLTRPFGATFGDFLTKSRGEGGVAFGTIGASVVFGTAMLLSLSLEIRRQRGLRIVGS